MNELSLSIHKLGQRRPVIQRSLTPLVRRRVTVRSATERNGRATILHAGDGFPSAKGCRVRSRISGVFISYYEVWEETEDPQIVQIYQMYLNVYRIANEYDEEELLGLHSDPSEPMNSPHGMYKISPHIHVFAGDQPFSHSHIALSLLNIRENCTSVSTLTQSFRRFIKMVDEQMLTQIDT